MSINSFSYFDKKNVIFLSFEGIEGCGKSTQIKLISQYLQQNTKYKVHNFREPGGTTFGEKLREAMLGANSEIAPLAEAHLFASSRCQLLQEAVLPLLSTKNNIVIYDRYIHSSVSYQGFGAKLGPDTILGIHNNYPLNTIPHLTIYLEIDIETSKKRQAIRNNKKDYFESKPVSYYQHLIDGFNYCKDNFSDFNVINGNRAKEEVHHDIISLVNKVI